MIRRGHLHVDCVEGDGEVEFQVEQENLIGSWITKISATILTALIEKFPDMAAKVLAQTFKECYEIAEHILGATNTPKMVLYSDGSKVHILIDEEYDEFMMSGASDLFRDELDFYETIREDGGFYAIGLGDGEEET